MLAILERVLVISQSDYPAFSVTSLIISFENVLLSICISWFSKDSEVLGSIKQEVLAPGFTGTSHLLGTVEDVNGMLIGAEVIIWFPAHGRSKKNWRLRTNSIKQNYRIPRLKDPNINHCSVETRTLRPSEGKKQEHEYTKLTLWPQRMVETFPRKRKGSVCFRC